MLLDIDEIKYRKSDGWRYVWILINRAVIRPWQRTPLDIYKMNVKPGGAQPKMHDTVWEGQVQKRSAKNDYRGKRDQYFEG